MNTNCPRFLLTLPLVALGIARPARCVALAPVFVRAGAQKAALLLFPIVALLASWRNDRCTGNPPSTVSIQTPTESSRRRGPTGRQDSYRRRFYHALAQRRGDGHAQPHCPAQPGWHGRHRFDPNANGLSSIALQARRQNSRGRRVHLTNSIGGQPRNRSPGSMPPTDGGCASTRTQLSGSSMAVQPDGKIFVAGYFNLSRTLGERPRNRIARLDAITDRRCVRPKREQLVLRSSGSSRRTVKSSQPAISSVGGEPRSGGHAHRHRPTNRTDVNGSTPTRMSGHPWRCRRTEKFSSAAGSPGRRTAADRTRNNMARLDPTGAVVRSLTRTLPVFFRPSRCRRTERFSSAAISPRSRTAARVWRANAWPESDPNWRD